MTGFTHNILMKSKYRQTYGKKRDINNNKK